MTASAEGGAWRRWARRGLAGMATLLLVASVAVVYLAYVWQPAEESGYRSAYLARVQPRQVATPVARFSYFRSGSGPPLVLVPGGALWSYSWRDTMSVLAALLRWAGPGQSEVAWSAWDQVAKTSSSNATASRRFTGSSTASS